MSATHHIDRRIPLGLAVIALLVACAAAGIAVANQLKAEEEAPAAGSRLLSQRGLLTEGPVTVEGGVITGYTCHAVVGGSRVTAKASTPWKACVLMAHAPAP
jgi:hypothetical protein